MCLMLLRQQHKAHAQRQHAGAINTRANHTWEVLLHSGATQHLLLLQTPHSATSSRQLTTRSTDSPNTTALHAGTTVALSMQPNAQHLCNTARRWHITAGTCRHCTLDDGGNRAGAAPHANAGCWC